MKGWTVIHQIRAMYDQGQGASIRQIAAHLKISRNTVRKYLREELSTIEGEREAGRRKLLDEHRAFVVHLLQTYPRLSAVKVKRKLEERLDGVTVSARSMRRYLHRLRGEVNAAQPRYYEPVIDEVPGVQCQVDPGELRNVLIGGIATTVFFVVFVLSFSRMIYVGLSRRALDTQRFIELHDEAFRAFGGCPQECVYDQTKLVVLEQYRELVVNERFAQYASTAGFQIRACEGYDPESKGKVEAGVKYVKNDALYGETFADWPALVSALGGWRDEVANCRVHGTTGEVPQQRFETIEQATLKPYLTPQPLLAASHIGESRKVDKTGLISFQGNKYSVPMVFQRGAVRVRIDDEGQLCIHHGASGDVVAVHAISPGKGVVVKNGDHYRDKSQRREQLEATIVEAFGEALARRLCAQLALCEPNNYIDKLRGVNRHLERLKRLPRAMLETLAERPDGLRVRTLLEYVSAFEANPERAANLGAPGVAPSPHRPPTTQLEAYRELTGHSARAGGQP